MASVVWDDASADVLSDRYLAFTRRTGALMELPTALNGRIGVLMFTGELAAAAALATARGSALTEIEVVAAEAARDIVAKLTGATVSPDAARAAVAGAFSRA